MVKIEFPLRLVSAANKREHWAVKAKRVKNERQVTWAFLINVKAPTPKKITLIRLAPRVLDGDNLQSSFKGVRDEVAKRFGFDDGDQNIEWAYAQEKSKEYKVRIEIE